METMPVISLLTSARLKQYLTEVKFINSQLIGLVEHKYSYRSTIKCETRLLIYYKDCINDAFLPAVKY